MQSSNHFRGFGPRASDRAITPMQRAPSAARTSAFPCSRSRASAARAGSVRTTPFSFKYLSLPHRSCLPADLDFQLVEPLKMLFKDEVRACGTALGLPDSMVYRARSRPGLGVRCLGAITRDRLEAVRESDAILREEFAKAGLEGQVWQYFTVIPDLNPWAFGKMSVRSNGR